MLFSSTIWSWHPWPLVWFFCSASRTIEPNWKYYAAKKHSSDGLDRLLEFSISSTPACADVKWRSLQDKSQSLFIPSQKKMILWTVCFCSNYSKWWRFEYSFRLSRNIWSSPKRHGVDLYELQRWYTYIYRAITFQYMYYARSHIFFVGFFNQLAVSDLFTHFLLDKMFIAASSK